MPLLLPRSIALPALRAAQPPLLLTGRRRGVARAAWGVVAAGSIGLTLLGVPAEHRHVTGTVPAFQAVGLGYDGATVNSPEGLGLLPVEGFGAERAGVEEGDRLLAVGGWRAPARVAPAEVAARLRGEPGVPVEVAVRKPDGRAARYSLQRSDEYARVVHAAGLTPRQRESLFVGLLLLGTLGASGLALLMFLKCPDDLAVLLGSLSLLLVSATNPLAVSLVDQLGWSSYQLSRWADFSSLVLAMWAFCVFPDGRLAPRWTAAWCALAPAVIGAAVFLPAAPGALLLPASFGVCLVAQVQRYRRHAGVEQRQQTKWVLWGLAGFVVLFAGASAANAALPESLATGGALAVWRPLIGAALWSGAFLVLVAGFTASLLRYRLWDIDAVASRSAVYTLLTLLLAAIWAGANQTAQVALGGIFGAGTGAASAGIAAGLAAVLFTPVHHRLQGWADHRFLRELTDMREKLPVLLGDLRETEEVAQLAGVVVERVGTALKSQRAAVYLRAEDGALALAGSGGRSPADAEAAAAWARRAPGPPGDAALVQEWSDRLFPLRVALRAERGGAALPVGWLALGPRVDGGGYGRDELAALEEVAGPVARALWIVQARARREADAERRIAALERLVHAALPTPGLRP